MDNADSSKTEKSAKLLQKYLDQIDSIEILKLLEPVDLEKVFETAPIFDLPPDASIVEQGDPGDSLMILLAGNAAAHYTDKYGNKRYLTKFKTGDFFGERGYFRDGIRNATIFTITASTILELSADSLKKLIGRYPEIYDLVYEKLEERERSFKLRVVNSLKLLKDREVRDHAEGEAKFQLAGLKAKEEEPHFGFVRDFSASGCLIEMDGDQFMKYQSHITNKLIPIAIRLDETEGLVSAVGKVCWYEQATGMDVMGYRVNFGVHFIKLFGDSEKLIAGLKLQSKVFSRKV